MQPLVTYYRDRIALHRELYFARHPAPALLHRRKIEAEMVSHTTRLGAPPVLVNNVRLSAALPELGIEAGPSDGSDIMVYAIRKRRSGSFRDRITIGRTHNMDVWLPLGQVSRFHAYFTVLDGGERYLLTDKGSTNGTFLSGNRLAPERAAEVRCGALVQFGDFQALFFTPAGLYALLTPKDEERPASSGLGDLPKRSGHR